MIALRVSGLAALCLVLTGCPALLGSLVKSPDPSFLEASRGRGDSIHVDWAAPTYEDDEGNATKSVDVYRVYRDGTQIATTSRASYDDSSGLPGREYEYEVDARMDDGTTTGRSNSDTGWYVPAEDLKWTGSGTVNHSGSGWFETVVVEGWTYHLGLSASDTVTYHDHESPEHLLHQSTGTSDTWEATRTGRVWIDIGDETSVVAWHD